MIGFCATCHTVIIAFRGSPGAIKRLIEHFDRQLDQICLPNYNEAQLRVDFVNPMFAELGWDIDNRRGYAEQYREVIHEDRVKVSGATEAPDNNFRVGIVRRSTIVIPGRISSAYGSRTERARIP